MNDEYYIHQALTQAAQAEMLGEIPIGAIIVANDEIIAATHNRTITDNDPSAHAEILALRAAGNIIKNHRLSGISLYVTLEPCIMCTGALIQARIERLVFGAYDNRVGACGSAFDLARHPKLNHHIHEIKGGVLEEECRHQLQHFFQNKRQKK
ncbi:MAG: tRNA adenosine(34) deaminase TadA [Cardiobacteriaceae bacterium]|nr:tRNA adenosine(34) deaminase TadA [Cardiobacteriaceae bacterium]